MNAEELKQLFGKDASPPEAVVGLARAYLQAREAKEDAEAALKTKNMALAKAERELLDRMAESGLESLKLEYAPGLVATVATSSLGLYSLPSESLSDPSVLRWLLRSGGHDLLKRTVNAQSFSAFCRELAAEGRAIHPKVKVAERKGVRLTRKGAQESA